MLQENLTFITVRVKRMRQCAAGPVKRITITMYLTNKADEDISISTVNLSYSQIRRRLPQIESVSEDSPLRIPWNTSGVVKYPVS